MDFSKIFLEFLKIRIWLVFTQLLNIHCLLKCATFWATLCRTNKPSAKESDLDRARQKQHDCYYLLVSQRGESR